MPSRPAVLVVEDEKAISDLVAFHLEQTGFEPIVAGDAKRAFELTRDRLPALVILDLMLPDMDGLDILKILRSQERSWRPSHGLRPGTRLRVRRPTARRSTTSGSRLPHALKRT